MELHEDSASAIPLAQAPIYVVATTPESTRQALGVARAIGLDRHAAVNIVAAPTETICVSSARANVERLPVEYWDPYPAASLEYVRALAAAEAPGAHLMIDTSPDHRDLPALLSPGATVVLSGPIRHFLESPEQRLARRLSDDGYDVVFIPSHGSGRLS